VPLLVAALVILFGFSIAYTFLEQNVWAAQLYFTGGLTLAGLSSAVVVGALVLTPNGLVSRILSSPPMLYMGKRTYGIYLYHFPIIFGLQRHGPGIYRHLLDINVPPEWLWVPTTLIAVPATFLVAHLSYALVEAPALSLKRRF
jgi:peptidoglycan/LPS O-acetylase OafA/YrhL